MSTSTNPLLALTTRAYDLLVLAGKHLQSPLLLLMRVVWGVQLMQAGWGKLMNIDKPIGYFTDLHIPFPVENAWLVAFTETFGGLFLVLGLLSRLTAIPLTINFIVALHHHRAGWPQGPSQLRHGQILRRHRLSLSRHRPRRPHLRPRRLLARTTSLPAGAKPSGKAHRFKSPSEKKEFLFFGEFSFKKRP